MTGSIFNIDENTIYIGVDDPTLDYFENQYRTKEGISYNSYIIKGEKIAVVDTTDDRTGEEWLFNLRQVLGESKPDYLIIEHLEPDHSSLISTFMEIYPDTTIVLTTVAANMLPQYIGPIPTGMRLHPVKDGDVLDLGGVTLKFFTAPMVHWPEVMMAYCPEHKTLFSADAFGTFGTLGIPREKWDTEARRYYYNIVGKYGPQVQNVLKKLSGLEIDTICPLHGPILTGNTSEYIKFYDIWSRYLPENEGIFIACASIHGNTLQAAEYLAARLRKDGVKDVYVADLTRDDHSAMVAEAFKYPTAVFCASSYDAGLFTPMFEFLHLLEIKGYKNRKAAIIENGSWAPSAGKIIRSMLESMKNIEILPDTITIRGVLKDTDKTAIDRLAEVLQ